METLFPATLDEQLLFATTPIFYEERIIGTGFFYRPKPEHKHLHFLISTFHVFQAIHKLAAGSLDVECTIEYHMATGGRVDEGSRKSRFTLKDVRVHENEDLAAVRLSEQPGDTFFRCLEWSHVQQDAFARNQLPVCLTVLMPGYPHGLYDEVNRYPLFRVGSTASHPGLAFRGRPEGRLNMVTAPVDSGAPIIGKVDLIKQPSPGGFILGSPPTPLQAFVFLGIYTGAEEPAPSADATSFTGNGIAIARYLKARLLEDVNLWTRPDGKRWADSSKTASSDHSSPVPIRTVIDSSAASPSKSHSPQKLSPSPLSVSSVSPTLDEFAILPTKLRHRLDGERSEMVNDAKSSQKKAHIELAFKNCVKLFKTLSAAHEATSRRFRTPAIFCESNGEGFEVVWYPGLTVLVRATSIRCYDGNSPTPGVDLSSSISTVFDQVSNWLRNQSDFERVPIDEETDTEDDL